MALAGLPFAEFLAVLQARGIPIGIPEHQDLGKLLLRFEHARRDELRDSIAALLARNHEDLLLVRALFDDLYPAVDPPSPPTLAEPPPPRKWLRRLGWAALCVVVLALALGVAWRYLGRLPPNPLNPLLDDPTAPLRRDGERPPLPEGKPKTSLRPLTGWLALGFGGLFAALWLQRMRYARRRHARTLRDETWQALSGPDVFRPQPPQPPLAIARDDIEEFATLLSLLCAEYDQGSALDIDRSVEEFARTGYLLQPARLRSLLRQPIVVLQDRSLPSALFAYKADALVHGLQRSGVPIYRYSFSGRADRVQLDAQAGSRETLHLAELLRLHPGAPLCVISLGTNISDADAPWLDILSAVTRRAWLLPLCAPLPSSQRLRALFPQRIFALHRGGLRGVAYALAQDQDRRPGRRIVAHGARHATQQETTRLLRRLAFLPLFDLPLADWLRQRCCPDVPEAALLSLLSHCEGVLGPTLRLASAHREHLQRDLQSEEPDELAPLRRALIEIFQSSEPASGSLAHLRWQLALSTQRIHSADKATATAHDRKQLAQHLQSLQESPLAPELQAVLRQADPQVQPTLQPLVRSSSVADADPSAPLRLAAPGLREVLLASIGTALLAGLLLLLGQGRMGPPEPLECLKVELGNTSPGSASNTAASTLALVKADCGSDGPPVKVRLFVAQGSDAPFRETERTVKGPDYLWTAELPSNTSAYYAIGEGRSGRIVYSRIRTIFKVESGSPAPLISRKVSFEILSSPSGAVVKINGQEEGTTPLATTLDINVTKTRNSVQLLVRIEVSLLGYDTYYEERANFDTNETVRIFARLQTPAPAAAPDGRSATAVPAAPGARPVQKPAVGMPMREKPGPLSAAPTRAEALLNEAQNLYINGKYKEAIDAAEKLKRYNADRAYRIIGSAACQLGNLSLAKTALRNTTKGGAQYIIYICQRNGLSIAIDTKTEKATTQAGAIDEKRAGSSEPSPPRIPARREQPVLDREAEEPRPQAPPPPR